MSETEQIILLALIGSQPLAIAAGVVLAVILWWIGKLVRWVYRQTTLYKPSPWA